LNRDWYRYYAKSCVLFRQYSKWSSSLFVRPETFMDMKVISVNCGLPRQVVWRGRSLTTGIYKEPVKGRVALRRLNLLATAKPTSASTAAYTKLFIATRLYTTTIGRRNCRAAPCRRASSARTLQSKGYLRTPPILATRSQSVLPRSS
jgi:hypothetical protein